MFVFGNNEKSRGCFHAFNLMDKLQGAALYFPDQGGPFPSGDIADPYFVTGVEFAQKEKYHLVECFNDTVHTYAFGFDPKSSLISVHFTAFIMQKDGTATSTAFNDMLHAYEKSRLSFSQQLTSVAFGKNGIVQGFLVAMSTSPQDAQHNLQNFSLTMLAVQPQIGGFTV